jgi:hypothetical protein
VLEIELPLTIIKLGSSGLSEGFNFSIVGRGEFVDSLDTKVN